MAANSPNKSQIFPPLVQICEPKPVGRNPGNVCLVFELSLSISVPIDIMSSAKVPLPYFRLQDPKVWRSSHPKVMPFHSTPVQSPICVCCSSDPLADRRTATQPVNVFGGFFDFAQVAGTWQPSGMVAFRLSRLFILSWTITTLRGALGPKPHDSLIDDPPFATTCLADGSCPHHWLPSPSCSQRVSTSFQKTFSGRAGRSPPSH